VELTLIILSQEAYHERTVKWEILSQAYGYMTAFAKRHQRSGIADVFDHVCAHIQEPVKVNTLWVNRYDIEQRFPLAKQHYSFFLQVSRWFQFLKEYLPPGCAMDADVFEWIQKSTSYFQDETRATAVLLKLLYRFAQLEGLPVRQQWLEIRKESKELHAVLHQPLAVLDVGQISGLESMTASLHQWILQYSGHAQIPFSADP
jgi:hypothetical protein